MTEQDLRLLQEPQVRQFIREHEADDPYALSLQGSRHPDLPIRLIAEQIQTRQKARRKLPEWYETEGVVFPPSLAMEQCSSEATARYKSQLVSGNTAVDLTGGAGVDTYYLSQVFQKTVYVEQNPHLAAYARHNFSQLGAPSIDVENYEAGSFLAGLAKVDLIYLDPARRNDAHQKVFRLSDCSPDVRKLLPQLLDRGRQVMLKTSPMLDIEAALREIDGVTQVHVVAVGNECREVVYLLSSSAGVEPGLTAVNLETDSPPLRFTLAEESAAPVSFSEPQQYLYEPNAAILKAGAFRSVAHRWNVLKLHPNTHLYTSDLLVPGFPGRVFRVDEVLPYRKKAVLPYVPAGKANITTRNFSDPVATVRKKLGLAEGGDAYLFATQTSEHPRTIILTHKVGK